MRAHGGRRSTTAWFDVAAARVGRRRRRADGRRRRPTRARRPGLGASGCATPTACTGCGSRCAWRRASTSSGSASGSTRSTSAAGASTPSCSSSTSPRASTAARTCRCRSRTSSAVGGLGLPRPHRRGAPGSTSAHRTPDRLVVEAALGGGADEALDVALYDGAPRDVLRAFLDEVGRAEELPDWVFRLWASGNEWNTQAIVTARMDTHRDLDIPVGVVVIEAWSDEQAHHRSAATPGTRSTPTARRTARRTSPTRADGAWPDPKAMVDELHARGIKVRPVADPAAEDRARPRRARRRQPTARCSPTARAMVARRPRGPRGRRRAVPQPRLVVPAGAHGRPVDRGAAATGGPPSAATSSRSSTSTASRPTAASTPGATTCAYARRPPRRRGQQPLPGALRPGVRRPAALGRQGAGDVLAAPGSPARQAHGAVLGRRRGLDLGGVPHSVTAGHHGVGLRDRLLGLGPRRLLRAGARRRALPARGRGGDLHAGHAVPLRVQPPPPAAAGPDAVERRRESGDDPGVVDVFRRYAELRERLVPYLARAGASDHRDRPRR